MSLHLFPHWGAHTSARTWRCGPVSGWLSSHPFVAPETGRWSAPAVRLYDLSLDVCDLWHFLIHSSERDIAAIPDRFERDEDFLKLPRGPRLLCGFWVSKGRAEAAGNLSPWYFKYRNDTDCKVWGPAVKARIIAQKPLLAGWSVDQCCYTRIPMVEAHWHVDPPYNNGPGRRYPHSSRAIDFEHLAEWCRALPGAVDVCENVGADWLTFEPLYNVTSTRGRRSGALSQEAVFRIQ